MDSQSSPWRIKGNAITDNNGEVLFLASQHQDLVGRLHLAAAAPELLAALENASVTLHALGSGGESPDNPALVMCHALQPIISKARFGC